jgi:hypothetical protein
MLYLLTLTNVEQNDTVHGIPEVTLWENFGAALTAAIAQAALDGLTLKFDEVEVEAIPDGVICIPGFCDIMPITISKLGSITWFGAPRKEQSLLSKRVN